MKKLIALMLSMMMVLGLFAGCGGETDTPATDTPVTDTPAPTPDTPAPAPRKNTGKRKMYDNFQ